MTDDEERPTKGLVTRRVRVPPARPMGSPSERSGAAAPAGSRRHPESEQGTAAGRDEAAESRPRRSSELPPPPAARGLGVDTNPGARPAILAERPSRTGTVRSLAPAAETDEAASPTWADPLPAPATSPPPPFSLLELTRRFGEMAWIEEHLSEVVRYWSTVEKRDELSVIYAETARHHAWHADLWRSALPATPSIDVEAKVLPPNNGWVDLFNELVAIEGDNESADRVASLSLVVDPWIRIRNEQLAAASNPISDRSVQRLLRFVTLDHQDDHDLLLRALGRIPGAATSGIRDRLFPLIGDNH